MKCFLMSDIHIDFFIDLWKRGAIKEYDDSVQYFEKFYDMYMSPADAILSPGDFANDYYTMVNFIKWLSTKYKKVYLTFGNHDLGVVGHTFGNGNPQHSSEERMADTIKAISSLGNVFILEGNIVDGIGGCMGMCDLSLPGMFDDGLTSRISRWVHNWYDGRVWRYMNTVPDGNYRKMRPMDIWHHYRDLMTKIVEQKPKVMMTHFCPVELGFQRRYEGSSSNCFFYFQGAQFLDLMDNDTYWICGHIHGMLSTDYVNAAGNTIHIMSVPNGYPGENPYNADPLNLKTRESRIIEI